MSEGLESADFIALALEEARLALEHDDIPVGAVLVREGKVIAKAHNRREEAADPSAHAEICVLRLAGENHGHWNLSGCTLYVTLEPCPMCAGALVLARLKELVYAAADPKGGAISLGIEILNHPKLNHRVKVRQGPLAEECGEILRDFFRKKRKKS